MEDYFKYTFIEPTPFRQVRIYVEYIDSDGVFHAEGTPTSYNKTLGWAIEETRQMLLRTRRTK